MKIAFIVGTFPALSVSFILNQITGLMDNGHEVDIYALDGSPADLSKLHPVVKEYHLLDHTYYPPKRPKNALLRVLKGYGLLLAKLNKDPLVCLQLLKVSYSQDAKSKYGSEAKLQKLLYKALPLLGRKSYDIVHCQFGQFGLIALAFQDMGILKGNKLLTSFRGYDISKYLKKRGEQVYDRLFKEGDFFLANSEFFRHRAIKLGCPEEKIVVHGSGIDRDKFTFNPRYLPTDGRVRIATTGRLVEKKGIAYCIRAIAQLAQSHPNIEYHIIGDGPLKADLQYLIQELGVERLVKLRGGKPQPELIEILNTCQLFMATSVTAKDGNQDAPVNTLKEAMAMGMPVIGTHHGGIPELVEDGVSGFLTPERDAAAIAEKLKYLIDHPEVWPQMGRAGRTRVEQTYNINQLNHELMEIYQQLLNSERPQSPTSAPSIAPPVPKLTSNMN